jgi:hypothetical protein
MQNVLHSFYFGGQKTNQISFVCLTISFLLYESGIVVGFTSIVPIDFLPLDRTLLF